MKISAALIVKNEERTLGRCLASIRDHVDEIVVVDTGSTDATERVARQNTDRVFHTAWRRDFSHARQQAFDRATGDWVFWIDADDVVLNAHRIRETIEAAPRDVKAFYWKYVVGRDEFGNSTCEFWRERCVRHEGLFRWVGRVHEVLVPRVPCATARVDDVVVLHLREPKPDRPVTRNLDILHEEYLRSRRRPAPRLLLCLANEYADTGQVDAAIEFFNQYVRSSTWNDEKYFAQLKLARLYRQQQRHAEAIDMALQALKNIPFWANAYFSIAESYYYQKDWGRVAHWIELGKNLPAPETICVVSPREYRYDWIVHYTNALFHLGRLSEAISWSEKALSICPADVWHSMNWHFFAESIRQREFLVRPQLSVTKEKLPTIFWHGPLYDHSGYADEGRQFVLGLDTIGERVRAVPYFCWNTGRVALPRKDFDGLSKLICTPVAEPGEQVISVCHMTADSFQRIPGAVLHVGRTMCETDRIPAHWVNLCNNMDRVWVPCDFNVETFASSGVHREKLEKIPEAIDVDLFRPDVESLPLSGSRGFNFLSIFEWGLRKGWDALLLAFVQEFGPQEDVALILKTGAGGCSLDHMKHEAQECLKRLGRGAAIPPNVIFHRAYLPTEQLPRLYKAADAFVLPSRGEGWGRPLMEAMLMGVPSIATRWSGHLEFMDDSNSWLVDCQLVDVPEQGWREAAIYKGHRWAEPDVAHLRSILREVATHREAARRKAERGRERILRNYNRSTVANLLRERLLRLLAPA
jgi:glycosyltransferase involved in cell wall biosynthesis